MNDTELSRIVGKYFITTERKWPTTIQAMMWAQTEIGESLEVLLRQWKWKRNNKEKEKLRYSNVDFGEELGDAILMLMIAGLTVGVDPVELLIQKMQREVPDVRDT